MFHVKPIKYFPEFILAVFILALPLQIRILYDPADSYIDSYFSYQQAIFFYLTDILFLGFFVPWIIFGKAKELNTPLFLKILAYLSLVFITLFHVKHLDIALYQALKWVEMFGLSLYIWKNINETWKFHIVLLALYLSGIFQAILGILQFHVQHSLNLRFLGEFIAPLGTPGLATIDAGEKLIRAYGTMPHPNVLGGFLVIGLIIGLFYVSRETYTQKWPKLLVSCGTIILILGLFFTFSRVAWLSAILAILGFALFNLKAKNKDALAIMIFILIVSCGTIIFGYQDLAKARISEDFNSPAVLLRADFNQMGIEVIKKYPVLGVGVGNYVEAQKDLFTLEGWEHQPPHNIYLFIASELGLLGLGLFLIIVFDIIKQAWSSLSSPLGFTLMTATVLILFMGMFDHFFITIQQGRLVFFLILGLALALGNKSENSLG